ncbi:MAG: diacylglycerol kinase family lipid kinase [Gemmatimonadetes bacterium]|nr:diacylglycerol kinase family lipid kinase [Gemmatimonadota bacterium]
MQRVLLITNPAAARTRKAVTDIVISVLKSEGCSVELVETTGHGDAARVARAGADDSVDTVAVYGGDGTVMQVVAGIAGRDIPVGLIPGGTGNLLAGNLGLPRNPANAARVIARGRPRTIDLGRFENGNGAQYFSVACGSGFDAELMARTSGAAKRRWGFAAYVARAFELVLEAVPVPYRVSVDGEVYDVEATSIMVANCGQFIPPILSIAPGIALDDGQLDVVVIKARGLWQSAGILWRMLRQRVDGVAIRRFRGRHVKVEAYPDRLVQLDGEIGGHTPFSATVVDRGLSVLVPAQ